MSAKSIIAAAVPLMLIASLALADKVMLHTGELLTGTLANRDAVRAAPLAQPHFSLLMDGSTDLKRLEPQDIDYIVLEDEDGQQVVDLSSLSNAPLLFADPNDIASGPAPVGELPTPESYGMGGLPLILVGGTMAAIGGIVKFGDEKYTITAEGIGYQEESYNAFNYVLMAVGGAVAIAGTILDSTEPSSGSQHSLLTISPQTGSMSRAPVVGFRLKF